MDFYTENGISGERCNALAGELARFAASDATLSRE
jgi:hypothetical protein